MSRILLADRSPHAQRMGQRILHEEGFEVVTVTSGETALIRFDDFQPDLVMVDAALPDVSGFQVCARLKGDERTRRIPVVLTAGESDPFDEQEARDAGADGILRKPFEASLVAAEVRRLLGQDKAAPAPPRAAQRKPSPPVAVIDPERVRAAVLLALDAALPVLTEEITRRVLVALSPKPVPAQDTQVPDSRSKAADHAG
jgi:DNA-binding response OmpR family regulator